MRRVTAAVLTAAAVLAAATVRADAAASALDPAARPSAGSTAAPTLAWGEGAGGAVAPVPGPVVRAFAPPASRYGAGHRGVDLAAAEGDLVVAALDGTVSFAGPVAGVGWVTVDHGAGLATTYGPLEPRLVRRGEHVVAGDGLGLLALGAVHLDWGARLGPNYIDPLSLLGRWEIHLTGAAPPEAVLVAGLLPDLRAEVAAAAARAAAADLSWPVRGPVTSGFGVRVHPLTRTARLHAGMDIAAPTGTPVRAAAAGTVAAAGWRGGYGLMVELRHAGGTATRYAHLSGTAVTAGHRVGAGQVLGAVGSTGASTGPHLHFEVRVAGRPVDPRGRLGP